MLFDAAFRGWLRIGILCSTVVVSGCGSPQSQLTEALVPASLQEPTAATLEALELVTKGTRYENNWVTNPAADPWKGLAVFLLQEGNDWRALARRDRRLGRVRQNCRAFLHEEAILCDAGFPEGFLRRQLGTTEQAPVFMRWLFGHELGHLLEGTEGIHSLNQEGGQPSIRSLKSQRREYAADCWMIHQVVGQSSPEARLELEKLALDLINSRFREASLSLPVGVGIIYDYNRLDPYDFVGMESYPDLILRSLRLLHVSSVETDQVALQAMLEPVLKKMMPDPLWQEDGPCRQANKT